MKRDSERNTYYKSKEYEDGILSEDITSRLAFIESKNLKCRDLTDTLCDIDIVLLEAVFFWLLNINLFRMKFNLIYSKTN